MEFLDYANYVFHACIGGGIEQVLNAYNFLITLCVVLHVIE